MGGCSSKPKTAEFDGSMETQDDKPQDEAPGKSLEVEKTGVHAGLEDIDKEQERSVCSIHTLLTEREQGDLKDIFAVTDKEMIADFSSEGNLKEGRQLIEDDHQHVKQILSETMNDFGAEKVHNVKNEILNDQINPGFITAGFHADPVLIMEVTKNFPGKSLLTTIEAETKETENEETGAFSESNILSLKDICISTAEDACKRNQEGPHIEVIGNGKVESNYHEAFCKNEEQRLDVSVGYEGHDNHFGEGSNEGEELTKETEAGACEVVNTANGGVLALESCGNVLKDSSKPIRVDEITGTASEEAAEELVIGTCIVKNSPFADVSNQVSSREIDSTDTHPAIATSVSPNNLHHVVDKQVLVQEDQEVDVDATYKMAMKDVKPQADIHLVNDSLMKESNVETFDNACRRGELISARISTDEKTSLLVSEEPLNVQLLLENSSGKIQDEKSNAAVICIEGERELDVSCASDEVTASQVTAITKKPEAQSVHAKEFAELALSPAQDISAPDIDEVLEKLASEFERQESLARSTS